MVQAGLGDVRLVTKAQLLWVNRGLGGNAFGVATSFDVDLPAPDGAAPSRVRFVGVDPRVGVPLGYIPARGTRKVRR